MLNVTTLYSELDQKVLAVPSHFLRRYNHIQPRFHQTAHGTFAQSREKRRSQIIALLSQGIRLLVEALYRPSSPLFRFVILAERSVSQGNYKRETTETSSTKAFYREINMKSEHICHSYTSV
jgi:hypothetical protein